MKTHHKTMQEITNMIYSWVDVAVNCWFKDQIRNPSSSYYAYYKASKGDQNGAIVISESPLNEDFHLITPERIPQHKTTQEIKTWLMNLSRQLPILAVE